MPGSPVDVKTHSRPVPRPVPSSSSATMPPLPSVNPSGPRPASFSSTTLTNGIHHSPPTLNAVPSPPQRYSNGPSSSSSSSLANQQLPATCGARQLSKLKRFLTTLQQFGNDISPEIGESVRNLVLALVNSTVTIEEFHSRLQEATNFPLRPFVIPFLKANLPLLQRELLHCARAAKQTPAQYLSQHEHLLLSTTLASPPDSSELLLEPSERERNPTVKRHSPNRGKENGFHERLPAPLEPPAKRICTISPAPRHSPANPLPLSAQLHPTPPPLQHYALEDISAPHLLHRESSHRILELRELKDRPRLPGTNGGYREEPVDHRLTDREWADEWRHLDHVLNCIVEMVEKTRRSVAVLRRCQESDREELNYWRRRSSEQEDPRKGGAATVPTPFSKTHSPHTAAIPAPFSKTHSPHTAAIPAPFSKTHSPHTAAIPAPFSKTHSPHTTEGLSSESQRDFAPRPGSGYVPDEIWRKAEEAVNEVKRQAMDEVQKAVAEAEHKAFEMITSERAKMEKTLSEAKRKATEDAIQVINEQEDSSECCWNCGRKASETCSGCNAARYCGSFCQHKDWERHHLICSPGLQTQPKPVSAITAARAAVTAGAKAPESVPTTASPGGEKGSVASPSSTPSTPTLMLETNGQ
ncbi:protein CBFA2T2-like isoform X3 [Oncorhynchus keta]|nr:protein CBFA2T2-like isoform X3 [Oncorhynchus keta]XP_052329951.1 protein CBFA2T2-like isoform X3 [Oncorhynchus keta]XP_052329952.1 protein CBFA2T2-like isoform X3 [Oncorhynchus keta]XP_052329953.1 protein CBFA2T2-like isoform X3 [Oncorhynchus keta]XP_052329954.1 protein CBFA2T2-like isoform X3 [Oncorhynchus keta]